ncbi:MAG TPA: ABC transporter substrate-binding protein, partial [Candidatus Melainabacteria bacterium]|nr:ABC transporter substrate-binding protein [Candidatus Melainabacteria bacterium]
MLVSNLSTSCTWGTGGRHRFEPDTLRMNLGNEPPSLDWHTTTDSTSFDVIANIMNGLPALASSWEIEEDGKRYVFHLREDIFWSDGKPVTAMDFVFAWRRLQDPDTGASYATFLYDIENAYEINTGRIKDLNSLG